jgi:hypothetical protein
VTAAENKLRILPADLRTARGRFGGYCTRGIVLWCRDNGVDFRALMRGTISVEEIERLNTSYGNQVAAIARERGENNVVR